MTDRLQEIEERVAKATPGPWTLRGFEHKPNVDFLNHAPADIRYLLIRLEAAEAVAELLADLNASTNMPTGIWEEKIVAWEKAKGANA